jgi:uncharacterized protein (TIGR02466 family)
LSSHAYIPPDILGRRKQILTLIQTGKRGEAEKQARALLADRPEDAETMSMLASLLIDRGAFGDAEPLLKRALELAPHSPVPWVNYGRILQQQNRWAEAETHYARAAEAFPREMIFQMTLGQIAQRAGHFAEAEVAFRHATEIDPRNALAFTYLGMVVLRQDRADEAATHFRHAIELDPKLAMAYGNLGNAEQKRGDHAAAEAAYEQASTLDPNDGVSYVSYGLALLRRGASREAAEIFDRALTKFGPERRAAAWFPYARAQELGQMPAGFRAEMARLVSRTTLTPPEGYASLAEFNVALVKALDEDRTTVWEPAGKATRKGGQTGLLLDNPREPFLAFERVLRKAIDAHFDSIRREKNHPFFGFVPKAYQLDIWGTLLAEGGHQHSHIHVGGWMSGVYYVALPPTMGSGEASRDGWIEFGHPPPEFDANFEPQTLTFEPKEGDAFFFPSYLFHRTLPFTGNVRRISLAFDVKPTSWR